jgi:AraC-like DNA-binding protein
MVADASFLSPRLEQHSYGQRPLHAIAGFNDAPLPLDIHVHREVEVGVVLSGEEQIHFSEMVQICRPGDVWLCASWEPHGWLIDRPRVRNAVLIFQPEFVGEEMLGELPWLTLFAVSPDQRPRVSAPEVRRRALAIGQTLRQEIESQPPDWEALVRIELLHLLLLLKREWGGKRPAPSGHVRLSTLARVMPALALSHSQPWRRVSVAEAASACGLSSSHFQSLFRRAVGMSFGQFSLRARLSFAANRMLNTERSVAAIATEAGFADGSHLHRRFRQQYQRTPRQYRATAQDSA